MKFISLNADAVKPSPMRAGDVAADLSAVRRYVVPVNGTVVVDTGLAINTATIPAGYFPAICSRSGMAAEGVFVANSPGIIDRGYTGELRVILHNAGNLPYAVEKGDRVAQLALLAFHDMSANNELAPRGDNGLGSTGVANEDDDVDMVSEPPHYKEHPVFFGEAWHYAQHMTFGAGNVYKYLYRLAGKDTPLENAQKAEQYLAMMIDSCATYSLQNGAVYGQMLNDIKLNAKAYDNDRVLEMSVYVINLMIRGYIETAHEVCGELVAHLMYTDNN